MRLAMALAGASMAFACLCMLQRCTQCVTGSGRNARAASRLHPTIDRVDGGPQCDDKAPAGDAGAGCLQQALWGKCESPFMRQACHRSCGRCESTERAELLRRTTLVSARQDSPCTSAGADLWVMRAMANKADYARAHGMSITWVAALLVASYDGAWNKLVYLHRLLRHELRKDMGARNDWLLWCDWDIIITDLGHELPLEDYEARGVRLVVGGDPAMLASGATPDCELRASPCLLLRTLPPSRVTLLLTCSSFAPPLSPSLATEHAPVSADLKLNTGVMLLRVHEWTLNLLDRMLRVGRKDVRHKHALAMQQRVKNLCVGCIDDQAVLLSLLAECAHATKRSDGRASLPAHSSLLFSSLLFSSLPFSPPCHSHSFSHASYCPLRAASQHGGARRIRCLSDASSCRRTGKTLSRRCQLPCRT